MGDDAATKPDIQCQELITSMNMSRHSVIIYAPPIKSGFNVESKGSYKTYEQENEGMCQSTLYWRPNDAPHTGPSNEDVSASIIVSKFVDK
jgi:hypothetical protein